LSPNPPPVKSRGSSNQPCNKQEKTVSNPYPLPPGPPSMQGMPMTPGVAAPMDYASVPTMPPRPGSVTALSWVLIIWCSLGLIFGLIGLVAQGAQSANSASQPPELKQYIDMMNAPTLKTTQMVTMPINLLLGLIAIIGGILSLKLRPAGRTLLLTYGIASAAMTMFGLFFLFGVMFPRMDQFLADHPGVRQATNPAVKMIPMMVTGTKIFIDVLTAISIGLIVWTLAVMSRPHVKEAFERAKNAVAV
jgi:hypothetical protein